MISADFAESRPGFGPTPDVRKGAARGGGPLFWVVVRRRPTLPHSHGCSTIGAGGLSFRVRNGSGRFPAAMAAVTLLNCTVPALCVLGWVFRCSGVAQWT